jgi:ABC-type uncharacterized transport system substrate-binding protein
VLVAKRPIPKTHTSDRLPWYVEGETIAIDWRFGTGGVDASYSEIAAELVALPVDVIVVGGGEVTPATQAFMRATSTIPVVAVNANDPVGTGLVDSLHRRGNVTALTGPPYDHGKFIELLTAVVPGLTHIAHLSDTSSAAAAITWREVQAAAEMAGVQVQRIELRAASDLDSAFSTPDIKRADALINGATALLRPVRVHLAELALQQRLPSMGGVGEYAPTGLLMTYGPDLTVIFRVAATCVDKLLKGAKTF